MAADSSTPEQPADIRSVGASDGRSHLKTRLGAKWRANKPLLKRAIDQMRSARGFGGKMRQLAVLARKALQRSRRRRRMNAAVQSTVYVARLADAVVAPGTVPECRALGGGLLAMTLSPAMRSADISVRDRHGTIYSTHEVERIPRTGRLVDDPEEGAAGELVQVIVQGPSELLGHSENEVDVIVGKIDPPLVFERVRMENASNLAITGFNVEQGLVHADGFVADTTSQGLGVGLFVDGKFICSRTIAPGARRFSFSVALEHQYLDGRTHLLELRELPNFSLLGALHEPLALHVTPWHALQTHARAPLDGTLSPLARHHFRSYQLWVQQMSGGTPDIPPLAFLHAELLHGPRAHSEYPRLAFPVHERPTVSVIVPAHNNFEMTYFCLCALLFAYNECIFEVIVVDDGSDDKTRDIEEIVRGIRTIRHARARGYLESCNDGAAIARGEFITLLNNDTEVTARWLDELVRAYRSFDAIGLLGSKLIYPDGRLQEAGGIIWKSGNPWNVGRGGNAHDPAFNYLREVDYVSGAALMIPRTVWDQVGGFSGEYAPGYFEDTDLAMKVRELGKRVVFVPTSTVVHFEGQTSGTDTQSGMKRFQEINRPKFKQRWAAAVRSHGPDGQRPDREKDRAACFRVLFLDYQFPQVDADAGSYAAFQEIRLFQSLGGKATFLPRNLAWMDRHTVALQRIGVECLYSPFVMDYMGYIRERACEFDAVFICRHQIAEQVVAVIRNCAPSTRILFNLADLHFLRELREAGAGTPGYTFRMADTTRAAELAVISACDLSFSYSDVERAVLSSKLAEKPVAKMPWVVETPQVQRQFADTDGLLFIGGFNHPPNLEAIKFFARDILPLLRERLPHLCLNVAGSRAENALQDVSAPGLNVTGYVADLEPVLARARVFVAPLRAGAGLKGKVLDAIAHGVPCVLSPVAAEATGLTDGISCVVADSIPQWVDCIEKLYTDESLWARISQNGHDLAASAYGFAAGRQAFANALTDAGIRIAENEALVYRHTRPQHYGL